MYLITDVKNAAVKSEDFASPNANVLLSVKSKRLLVRAKVVKMNAEPRNAAVSAITSNVCRVFVQDVLTPKDFITKKTAAGIQ